MVLNRLQILFNITSWGKSHVILRINNGAITLWIRMSAVWEHYFDSPDYIKSIWLAGPYEGDHNNSETNFAVTTSSDIWK